MITRHVTRREISDHFARLGGSQRRQVEPVYVWSPQRTQVLPAAAGNLASCKDESILVSGTEQASSTPYLQDLQATSTTPSPVGVRVREGKV